MNKLMYVLLMLSLVGNYKTHPMSECITGPVLPAISTVEHDMTFWSNKDLVLKELKLEERLSLDVPFLIEMIRKVNDVGRNVLHQLVCNKCQTTELILHCMQKGFADHKRKIALFLCAKDFFGNTVFHYLTRNASENNNFSMVKLMLSLIDKEYIRYFLMLKNVDQKFAIDCLPHGNREIDSIFQDALRDAPEAVSPDGFCLADV